METFLTIAQGLLMFALTFLVLLILVVAAEWKNKRDMQAYQKQNLNYIKRMARENNLKAPMPTAQDVDPKKPIEKGRVWAPSKDLDYKMKGKLVDPFD